ncbi:MAG: hypothetical protein QW057_02255 [Candidatus Bathyarchaeia archaeon]
MVEGVTLVIQAVDQFSPILGQLDASLKRVEAATEALGSTSQGVGDRVKAAFESVGDRLEAAGSRIKAAMGLGEKSFKDLAGGVAGAAASGLAFAGILDQAEASQLRVAKAANRLEDAQLRVEKAQAALNTALEKYGEGSAEAELKARELASAQSDLEIATAVLNNAQQDQVKGMTQMVSQTIPMMIAGMATLYASMGPVGLVIAAITFAVQLLAKAWAENWLGIRDVIGPVIDNIVGGINAVIGAISGMIKWVQDALDWWAKLLGLKSEGQPEATPPAAPYAAEGEGFVGVYQTGGLVPRTGLALVHAGEAVLPPAAIRELVREREPGPVTVNLTLNAAVSGEADEERLARRVAEEISFALYRRQRTL